MPQLRSKDKNVEANVKSASPLLKWIKGGAKKGNAVRGLEVKDEVHTEEEEEGTKMKKVVQRRAPKVEEDEEEDEEDDSDVSEEEEEADQEEWKPNKKDTNKKGVKKAGKEVRRKGKKVAKPKIKKEVKKPKHEEEEEEEEEQEDEEESEEEGKKEEEEWKPEKKVVSTKVKKQEKPKKEELENDTLDQEDVEAQQDEDAKGGTVGDADFNEYERRRQENILKNKLLLQQLQLDSIALGPKPKPKPKPAHKPPPRRKKESSASAPEHVPRRQSSRIAGLPADSEKAKRRYEEESAALEQAERAKRRRVGGDLSFDVGGIDFSVKGGRFTRTFTDEDVKNTDNMDVKKLREKMMGLKIYERWVPNDIKITPERVYYLGFHPTIDKQLIFAGDKLGTLGVWDASSSKPNPDAEEDDDGKELPALTEFKIHPRTISSFAFSPFSMNTILTASYDSSIRSFDLAKGLSTEVYFGEDEEGISGVEIHEDNPYLVYFSTLEGRMGRKDTRFNGKADVWQLSDKKIGGFSMHPKQTHLCVTASLDRTIKIWDLRKIVSGNKHDEDYHGPRPAMIGEHTSRLSVSSAYWNRNGSIATTSYDDTVKLYRFPNAGSWAPGAKIPAADCGGKVDGEVEPTTVIRHNNQTGRWVTILRAQWQQNPKDGADKLVIGNMNRFLDIYAEDGTQLAQLGDDGLTAVPATAQFHPTENWVAGGTASGKVALWS